MNAVHASQSSLYRPQLGVSPGGQKLTNGSTSSLNERDDPRVRNNQGYTDPVTSPMSPSGGSDFSFSKYQNDTYSQQRINYIATNNNNNMGFAQKEEPLMSNSGSTGSFISQQSSESSAPRDVVVNEHYVPLKRYLTRHLASDGLLLSDHDLTVVGFNQRPNKAREKLVRLSKTQFNELSTDVYDELVRRQNTQSKSKMVCN
jgi:Spa2 homology domain (SHD) of GIT